MNAIDHVFHLFPLVKASYTEFAIRASYLPLETQVLRHLSLHTTSDEAAVGSELSQDGKINGPPIICRSSSSKKGDIPPEADSKTWISGSALSHSSPTSPTFTYAFPTPYLAGPMPINPPEFSTEPASLLKACSLINQEASQVLYSRNCFKVKATQALLKWLEAIGPQNTRHLEALHIIAGERYFKSWPKVLCTLRDQAPGLRHLFISWRHYEQDGEDCIRDALAEIRGLKKLIIDTSVLENCSLKMVQRSQTYLEEAIGIPVSLGPIASEMAVAVTSCCCELKCT